MFSEMLKLYQEILGYVFKRTENPHTWHEDVTQYSVPSRFHLAFIVLLNIIPLSDVNFSDFENVRFTTLRPASSLPTSIWTSSLVMASLATLPSLGCTRVRIFIRYPLFNR